MAEKAGLTSQGIVLLPLAHVMVCFLYLFGYSIGFGANLGMLFTASNLFGTALYSISRVYITGLLLPLLFLVYLDRTKHIPLVGTVDYEGKPEEFAKARSRVRRFWAPALKGMFWAFITLELLSIGSWFYYGGRFPASIIQTVLMVLYFRYFYSWIEDLPLSSLQKGLCWLAMSLPVAALAGGISAGQTDRRERYSLLADGSAHCGGWAVRRPVGELYLAISAREKRSLIDKDCKTKLTFPRRESFNTAQEDAAWWRSRLQQLRTWLRQLVAW